MEENNNREPEVKETVIKDIIQHGKTNGQISTNEILDAMGELDFDPAQIEQLYDSMESMGVEIIENADSALTDDFDFDIKVENDSFIEDPTPVKENSSQEVVEGLVEDKISKSYQTFRVDHIGDNTAVNKFIPFDEGNSSIVG